MPNSFTSSSLDTSTQFGQLFENNLSPLNLRPNPLNQFTDSTVLKNRSSFNTLLPNADGILDSLPPVLNSTFSSGIFTVGNTGQVGIDYLFDGGLYEGQVGIFNLAGLEQFDAGSDAFIQEVVKRVLSNSQLGHVVIADAQEGARFQGELGEVNRNSGDYLGVKTFAMDADSQFGIVLMPNGTFQQVNGNVPLGGDKHPLFSMVTANPNAAFQLGQIADVTGTGTTFVFEDLAVGQQSDRDYNDVIFQVRGAIGQAVSLDQVINSTKDWRGSNLGQTLLSYVAPYDDSTITQPVDYHFPTTNQPLIGIIDTGFAANNPDIDYSRLILGKDYVGGDNNPLLAPGEGNEHGTHILGIIGATQHNGIGIDGINDQAPIWLGRAIGSGQWAESLVDFVNQVRDSGQPNGVINLSLDLTQKNPDGSITTRYEFTPQERTAIEFARQNHVLIVAAAGNDGSIMSALGQASQEFDNILTVGASDGLHRADYSSYGYGLDILAPSGMADNGILSTVGQGIGTLAGTSVATAEVTGAISQVWAANPSLNYHQVIEILKSTATDLQTPGWDTETGAGLLNPVAAVKFAKTILGQAYSPEPWFTPNTWSGQGLVTPIERAADGNNPTLSQLGQIPANRGVFVGTVVSNGVTIHHYTNGYLMIQPNGFQTWYGLGSGIPAGNWFNPNPINFYPIDRGIILGTKADFNGDGKTDFIRQEKGEWDDDTEGTSQVYLSQGNGSFNKVELPDAIYHLKGDFTNLYMGDFNGDGKTDFIRQEKGEWDNDTDGTSQVYLSQSNGSFKPVELSDAIYHLKGDFTNLYMGDFNGDGKTDFIRQEKGEWDNDTDGTSQVYLSQGNGSFKSVELSDATYHLKGDFTNLYMGDFNGDGKTDFIRQEKGEWDDDTEGTSQVYLSQGNGSFNKVELPDAIYHLKGDFTNLYMGDFNSDGKTDFIRQEKGEWDNDTEGTSQVYLSQGNGSFNKVELPDAIYHLKGDFTNLYMGDFNGDGKTDFIRQEKGEWDDDNNNTANIYLSKGDGTFQDQELINSVNMKGDFTNLIVGDYDGDGKTDFIRQEKGEWDDDTVSTSQVYFSGGNGSFSSVELPDAVYHLKGDFTNLYTGNLYLPDDNLYLPDAYHFDLASATDEQWDFYGGESAQFGKYANFTDGDFVKESMPGSVLQVYEDLSTFIFGSVQQVNTGYAFDTSYLSEGLGYHAGMDINASNGTSIKAATNGIVAKSYLASYGYVVGVDEIDASGQETGRRWWYVHNTSNSVKVGDLVTAGQTEIGIVGKGHLHIAVTSSSDNIDPGNGISAADVQKRTMSPLEAFWKSRNNISGY